MSLALVPTLAPLVAATPFLVAIAVIDARSFRIPDRLSLPLFAMTVGLMAVLAATVTGPRPLATALLGSLLFTAILGVLHLVRPEGLGLGDVKLAASLGLLAGWPQDAVLSMALTVTWSLMLASAIGLTILGAQRARGLDVGRSSPVAFGPALCLGTSLTVIAAPVVMP